MYIYNKNVSNENKSNFIYNKYIKQSINSLWIIIKFGCGIVSTTFL